VRRRVVGGAIIATLLAMACGDTARTPREDPRARAYFEATPAPAIIDGRQWPSPTRRYIARSDSTAWAEERVSIVDTQTGRVVPIVTIRESDPGSGRSHTVAWTADGTALLIRGRGEVRGARSRALCLVYRVAEADLLSAPTCKSNT
jgi:hypothetical protein